MTVHEHDVELHVNGESHRLTLETRRTLADVLRHELGLFGTNLGCEHGICGACTVIVEGAAARSCLMFGVQADGCDVETVEGLAEGQELNDLQQAFSRHHALQCGFCTPGFLMLGTSLLREERIYSREEIIEIVSSNLCRCTGYQGIVNAVVEVQGRRRVDS